MSTVTVIISQPGQRTRSVEIKTRVVSIGRRADNTICLEADHNVSKYHAVIENREGDFWVCDLGSSNGTTVNDEPVLSTRKLLDHDLIGIGGTSTLEFHLAPAPEPPRPPATSVGRPPVFQSPTLPAHPVSGALSIPPVPPVVAPSMPNAPAPVQKFMGLPRMVATGLGSGLVATLGMLAVLFGMGIIGGPATTAQLETPEQTGKVSPHPPPPDPTPSTTPSLEPTPQPTVGGSVNTDATANLARLLAGQIAQKSVYHFDPGFVAQINQYINEYRNAAGYYERASQYREAIDREFINVQGIQPPLIGYVMAMSQTRFVEKPDGSGIWGLPPSILKAYVVVSSSSDLNDPAVSTRMAAAYMKSLLDIFDQENFMYAVACYGMTLDEAGQVRTELEKQDPGGQGRYDFWKMKNAGVVQGVQVERVARFYAAGIVGENPAQFSLKEKPLSSLY